MAREKAGLTQEQAADAWEVPISTLRQWEQNQRSPSRYSMKHLRRILDAILGAASTPLESDFYLAAAKPEAEDPEPESTPPTSPKRPRAKKSPPKPKRRRARSRKPRA